ncbi:hypothetical protein [Kribbella yunnanensis]
MKKLLTAMAVLPLAGAVLAPTTASASPDPDLTITSMTMNKTSVAVNGLATVPVTITLTGSFKEDPNQVLTAVLKPQGKPGGNLYAELQRVSGTDEHTTWRGVVNVPSMANGTLKLIGAVPQSYSGWRFVPWVTETPYDGAELAVQGTHIPKVTGAQVPDPAPYGKPFKIKWTVTDTATGKPYGTRVRMAFGGGEAGCYLGDPILTGTDGVLYTGGDGEYTCLHFPVAPAQYYGMVVQTSYARSVSATPSKTSARVGTIVPVNGTSAPQGNCTVNLQRLYGASQWRTVSSAKIRTSGRFTLNAQPSYRGKIPYRVLVPSCWVFVAASTKPFYIQGV